MIISSYNCTCCGTTSITGCISDTSAHRLVYECYSSSHEYYRPEPEDQYQKDKRLKRETKIYFSSVSKSHRRPKPASKGHSGISIDCKWFKPRDQLRASPRD